MSAVLDEASITGAKQLAPSLLRSLRVERNEPVVLSLDIGTSGVRAVLFDGRGEAIEGSHVALSNELLPSLRAGADTDANALVTLTAQAIDMAHERACEVVSRIDYVTVSTFWHSLLGVDDRQWAATPLLSWADTRASNAAEELRSQLDENAVHARTGCRLHPSYWPAKLLWLRQKRPGRFGRSQHWLSFSDYLGLRFFGRLTTSVSMASATGLFDQHLAHWDDELAERAGITSAQLTPIAAPEETFVQLRSDYAARWPLLAQTAWFPAIGDGAANNIGAGCTTTENVALMIGTSGAMRFLFADRAPEALPPELFCYRADRDRVVIGGAMSDGGGLYDSLKQSLALDQDSEGLERALSEVGPDSHGLTVLPFWSGERATGWSTSARGAITGLSACTRPIEILRAAMEAVSYRFALLSRALDLIAPQAQIVAAGKALLSSPVWAQMIADTLGRPIRISCAREASCRGAALLALETVGKIESIETLPAEFDQVYEPDVKRHQCYARAIERQQELYNRLMN